jgi:D-tyrosyl-tRNA(Tyr) deacylase
MRAVIQRVKSARVDVEGRTVGEIGPGLLVFLGVERGDGEPDLEYICSKVASLRIFEDGQGKMNLSAGDVDGDVLVVSQFTLLGDARRGRRPSFSNAADPAEGERWYGAAAECLRQAGLKVETGRFRAMMEVHLVNDGPVTILLDSRRAF